MSVCVRVCVCHTRNDYSTLSTAPAFEVRLFTIFFEINTLRTGDTDLRFYVTTVQDG